jgi:hypothetical protein
MSNQRQPNSSEVLSVSRSPTHCHRDARSQLPHVGLHRPHELAAFKRFIPSRIGCQPYTSDTMNPSIPRSEARPGRGR